MTAPTRTALLLLASIGLGFCTTAAFVLPVLAQATVNPVSPRRVAPPAPRPVMKHDVVVNRDIITLGDLVEPAGDAADTPVFNAPSLGRTGTIQAARIVDAALMAGLPTIDTGLVSQVVVTRAARKVTKAEMEQAVRKALAGRYGMDQADVSLVLEGNETSVAVEPEASGDIRVQDLVLDTKAQRIQATLSIAGSRALTLKPMVVSGQVIDTVEVPVLTRALQRGEPVRSSDIRLERRPRTEVATSGFVDVASLSSRVVRSGLQAGAVLREADLVKQVVVEKNTGVTVVYESPGLQLAMRGKAMEAGGIGDSILVQNVQSKRALQAVVTGPGRVSVSYGIPGPVASTTPAP